MYIAPTHWRQSVQSGRVLSVSGTSGTALAGEKMGFNVRHRFISVGLGIVYTCRPQLQLPVIISDIVVRNSIGE